MTQWKHKWTHYLGVASSLLCLVHCFALPFLFLFFPAFTTLRLIGFDTFWESIFVLLSIISVFTIFQVHKTHNRFSIALPLAFLGVLALTLSLFISHETSLYIIPAGSLCILFAHIMNLRFCNQHKSCSHHKFVAS